MQGTVFWMAPEVINTQKKGYNFKVDIWSVGCVVLEMWAGKRPWTGEEMVAVMLKVCSDLECYFRWLMLQQLYQSKLPPPVPDEVNLTEQADDFRMRCFAMYVLALSHSVQELTDMYSATRRNGPRHLSSCRIHILGFRPIGTLLTSHELTILVYSLSVCICSYCTHIRSISQSVSCCS